MCIWNVLFCWQEKFSVCLLHRNSQKFFGKQFVLALASSGIGSLGLLLSVWIIEFDFVGRFAILKMVLGTAFLSYLFLYGTKFLK